MNSYAKNTSLFSLPNDKKASGTALVGVGERKDIDILFLNFHTSS